MRKGTKRITVVVTAQSYYHLGLPDGVAVPGKYHDEGIAVCG